jgi:putative flippase GtrA
MFHKLLVVPRRLASSRAFRKYLFVGVTSVALDFFLLYLFRAKKEQGLTVSVAIAYWTSIAYNFAMNRQWTFGQYGRPKLKQIFSYLMLIGFNFFFTLAVISLIHSVGISEFIGKAIALTFTIPWTYLAYKKFVFKSV